MYMCSILAKTCWGGKFCYKCDVFRTDNNIPGTLKIPTKQDEKRSVQHLDFQMGGGGAILLGGGAENENRIVKYYVCNN